MKTAHLVVLFFSLTHTCFSQPQPIGFSIPECKVVKEIPQKDTDFAFIIPGQPSTYIYDNEKDYYSGYRRAYFGITTVKAGADCLRHYEILANGCIPYFPDLDRVDKNTMHLLPRELILEAMNLKGVSFNAIDHNVFDKDRYYQILETLLEHTREYLTCRKMAAYLLEKANYSGKGTVLFLAGKSEEDYLKCLTLIGLKELLGENVIDVPKLDYLYKSYPDDTRHLYGKGISYTHIIEDLAVNRDSIANRIVNNEFELIIYGSVHRGMPYHSLVVENYPAEQIIYLCGEDRHICEFDQYQNLFIREFDCVQK